MVSFPFVAEGDHVQLGNEVDTLTRRSSSTERQSEAHGRLWETMAQEAMLQQHTQQELNDLNAGEAPTHCRPTMRGGVATSSVSCGLLFMLMVCEAFQH